MTTTSTAPVLIIQYIEVENFKSYAGKHRIGPFHSTFTAVIGPNGSGKSNILDSLLFVFGKNAKKIRLDSMKSLIHSSAAFPNCESASVTVVFSYGEQTIRLTREVHKSSNSTQYLIDNRRKTQTEVVTFLKEKGVDLDHNRFLILQGEVEQIALMRPKADKEGEEGGFLEFLDDLIGTNRFVEPIKEASTVVESLQENRLIALEKSHKLGKERDLLEEGKNAAVNFVRKQNQFERIKSIMCQTKIYAIEQEVLPQRQVVKSIEGDLVVLKKKADEVDAQVDEQTTAANQIGKTQKTIEKERDNLKTKSEDVENDFVAAKASVDENDKDNKKKADKLKKTREELGKITLQLEDIARDKRIATDRVRELTTALKRNEPELERLQEALQGSMKPIREAIDAKRRDMAPVSERYAKAEQDLQSLNQKRDVIVQRNEAKKQEAAMDAEKYAKRLERLKSLQDQLRTYEQEMEQMGRNSGGASLAQIEKDLSDAQSKKMNLSRQIEDLKRAAQEGSSDDTVVQFLASKDIKGYHGQLRSLGTIDSKYDIAAGVSSGAWVYHVVDDETCASHCLQLLKESGVGRASFIVLNKIEKDCVPKMKAPFTVPSTQTQRLFDLIKPVHEKFYSAFYWAVRDTLVAPDLSTARKYGLGAGSSTRFRVVTLAGELVEPTGQVTGGGSAPPKGAQLQGVPIRTNKGEIRQQLQTLQTQLEKAHAEVGRLHDIVKTRREGEMQSGRTAETLRQKINEARKEWERENIEKKLSEGEATNSAQQLAASEAELRSSAFAKLKENIEAATKVLEKISVERAKYDKDMQVLQSQLDNIGGAEFKKLREQVERDNKQIADDEEKLADSNKVETKLKATKDKNEKLVKELEHDLKSGAESATAAERAEMMRLQKMLDDLKSQIKGKENQIEDVKSKREVVDKRLRELMTESKKLSTQEEAKNEELKAAQEKIQEKLGEGRAYETQMKESDKIIFENMKEFGPETMVFEDDIDTAEHDVRCERILAQGHYSSQVSENELKKSDIGHLKYLGKQLHQEIERLKEEIDLQSVKRWKDKDSEWRVAKSVYDDVHERTLTAENTLTALQENRKTEFLSAFEDIRQRLKNLYQLLTQGGDADLELVDAHDPFEGINFSVRPARKSWKQIGQLSGGEKTLASLSLVFALHHFKPTPLYIMDEIDAALDFRNVSIVAKYVTTQTIQAQFIIISLRNSMFEMAHQLVGVCKVKDCTQSIALNPIKVKQQIEARTGVLLKDASNAEEEGGPKKRVSSPEKVSDKRRKK